MSDLNLAYLARGPPTDHLFFFFKCILKPLLRYSIHTQVVLVVKDPPANAGDVRDVCSIPESAISPEGGHGNPLQYSCLENSMNRRAQRAIVHGVAKSRTRLKQHTYNKLHIF